MRTALIVLAMALLAGVLVLASLRHRPIDAGGSDGALAIAPAARPEATAAAAVPGAYRGFLYGRITTLGGASYEGRLRFGRGEEAFWGDYFNGSKRDNVWLAQVPPEQRPKAYRPIAIFGFEIARLERTSYLGRPFMSRFGDIARIEAHGREVRVILKSGAVFALDRLAASDFDDGVRVWDGSGGVVDLDSLRIGAIVLLPTARLGDAPARLHGTVHTRSGDFTGFVQWNRQDCVGSDELAGFTTDGEVRPRFDTIRSIARRSRESSLVTLLDGRELVLSGTREVGRDHLGIYVDDRRFGRVLVSWDAFERLDFGPDAPADTGPGYGDFPPGRPLTGSVTTRGGSRFAGRLVYDLDESEITETLDAPYQGVDYTIPLGLIASIDLRGREAGGARLARVTLQGAEELRLERSGDLGEGHAGMLIFVEDRELPEYVPWDEVERLDFDRPPVTVPPPGGS